MTNDYQTADAQIHARAFYFGYLPQLDGLRGIAILLVIVGHAMTALGLAKPPGLGGLGVLLFFLLSGFLITGLLDAEMQASGQIDLARFYLRRAMRLFPACGLFLFVICLLIKVGLVSDTPWFTVASCVLYLRNIFGRGETTGHLWSLSIEEQFYTFWPLAVRMLSKERALYISVSVSIGIAIFRMVAIETNPELWQAGVFYTRSWFRFDAILAGCAIILWLSRSRGLATLRSWLGNSHAALCAWLSILAWTLYGESVSHMWLQTLQMILGVLVLFSTIFSQGWYRSIVTHRALTWIGGVSYSWYLWQQLFLVSPLPGHIGSKWIPLEIAASLICAIFSRRFIELPMLRLRNRIPRRISAPLQGEILREAVLKPHV